MRTYKNRVSPMRILTNCLMTLIVTLLFSSCVHQRDLEYIREKDNREEMVMSFRDAKIPDYKLKPSDELFIQIKSLDQPSTNVFEQLGSQQSDNRSSNMTPYSASLMSYMIDKYGYIQLPVLGKILVDGKTIPEVKLMLKDSLNQILSNPSLNIKLVNRFVSVLGEVQRPGHFTYSQEKLTVFNALGLAGDITTYGDRYNVILARNEDGKNIRVSIDLTSSNIMASKYYYIRPNDMLYVKPTKKRFWGLDQFPWGVLLTTISTGILVWTVFN